MAISYPVSFPKVIREGVAISASEISLSMVTATSKTNSIFTFDERIQVSDGQRWRLSVSLPASLPRDQAKPWIAFLASLNGVEGTFYFSDHSELEPSGIGGGTPQVNNSGQTGSDLDIKGLIPDTLGILKAGDYFSINNNLYMALSDLDSNALGNGTLDIWPYITNAYADNTPIQFTEPTGTFRLERSNVALYRKFGASMHQINFNAMSI